MTDELTPDAPATLVEHVLETVSETKAAVAEGRQPGHVLDNLSIYARQSPLIALSLAFLIGIAVARRR